MKLKSYLEFERVFKFLACLNLKLDCTRGQVLCREPLPSLREVHAYVKGEESRTIVMLLDASTRTLFSLCQTIPRLVASKSILRVPKMGRRKLLDRDSLWCD